MPIGHLKDIIDQVPRETALLGLDVGKKSIGLALCVGGSSFATPLYTVTRTKFTKDIQEISKVIRDYEIGGYVLGLPINMDGSEGPRAQSIRDFAAEMLNYPDIFGPDPFIALWDERLSTASVEDFVDISVRKRKTRVNSKASGLIDKLAAQHILQGAIEFVLRNA